MSECKRSFDSAGNRRFDLSWSSSGEGSLKWNAFEIPLQSTEAFNMATRVRSKVPATIRDSKFSDRNSIARIAGKDFEVMCSPGFQ